MLPLNTLLWRGLAALGLLAGIVACNDGGFTGSSGATSGTPEASPSPEPTLQSEPGADKNDAVKKPKKKKTKKFPPDEGDESEEEEDLDTTEDALKPVPLPLDFVRLADTAAWDNCLFVSVNGGEEQKLGCNHSGAATGTVTVMAKPKPACNTLRLRLTSNGNPNWSTEKADAIATYFHLARPDANKVQVQANDNKDGDFNDLNLTVSGRGAVKFTIENSNLTCE